MPSLPDPGAQAIGAGRLERLGPILRTGLLINVWLTGGLVLLGYLMSHWLLGLFITDPAARVQAEHLLHIMLWSLLVFGFQAIIGGIMRASGTVLVPVAISIFASSACKCQRPTCWTRTSACKGCGWRFQWRT